MKCRKAQLMIDDVLDDELDEKSRTELDRHLSSCSECRSYRQGALKTRELLGHQPLKQISGKSVDRLWRNLQGKLNDPTTSREQTHKNPAKRQIYYAAVAVVVAASLAMIAVFAWPSRQPSEQVETSPQPGAEKLPESIPQAKQQLVEPAPETIRIASGSAKILRDQSVVEPSSEIVLTAGDKVSTSSSVVFSKGRELSLALGPETALKVNEYSDKRFVFEMAAGWIACWLDQHDQPFDLEVRTPSGILTVLGTIFSIAINQDGATKVRVTRGRVEIRRLGESEPIQLGQGRELHLESGREVAANTAQIARDSALLRGEFRPEPTSAKGPSNQDLFKLARRARKQGKVRQAATLYRQIASSDRRGSAGGTALISLGQLYLGPLRNPSQARQSFKSYLDSRPRGPLRQEALAGLYRAQKASGQGTAAARTAKLYLSEYPNGRYRSVFGPHPLSPQ